MKEMKLSERFREAWRAFLWGRTTACATCLFRRYGFRQSQSLRFTPQSNSD